MGFVDAAAGSIEAEEPGVEFGVPAEEGGRDEAADKGAVVEGAHLGACLEEGGEDGGFDMDATGEGGVEVGEDAIERLVAGEGGAVGGEEERSGRGFGVGEGVDAFGNEFRGRFAPFPLASAGATANEKGGSK